MAEIALGMWTSHGPTLSTTPEQWLLRVSADKKNRHPFRGEVYDFDSLVDLRKDEGLAEASALAERERRSASCQKSMEEMADRFAAAKIDVAVIMGNDQRELFLEDITPAISRPLDFLPFRPSPNVSPVADRTFAPLKLAASPVIRANPILSFFGTRGSKPWPSP